jgi:hypothetical protein
VRDGVLRSWLGEDLSDPRIGTEKYILFNPALTTKAAAVEAFGKYTEVGKLLNETLPNSLNRRVQNNDPTNTMSNPVEKRYPTISAESSESVASLYKLEPARPYCPCSDHFSQTALRTWTLRLN